MITLNTIFTASIQQYTCTDNICSQEYFRIFNRAVYMAFRRKVYHNIGFFFFKKLKNTFPVSNIALYEAEIIIFHSFIKSLKVA